MTPHEPTTIREHAEAILASLRASGQRSSPLLLHAQAILDTLDTADRHGARLSDGQFIPNGYRLVADPGVAPPNHTTPNA